MQHVATVVLVTLAALVLAAATSVAYGLAVAYSADVLEGGSWLFLVLLPAVLALLCLLGARPVGPPRPRTPVLALGVLVLFAATVSGAAAYGGSVHERHVAARTTACSPEDVALLQAVDAPGAHTEPTGQDDGGCAIVVSWVPDAAEATARVVASLEGDGWQEIASEGDERVFRRGEVVLRLSAASDGKATDVRLTLW